MSKYQHTQEISQVIKKQRNKAAIRNGYFSLFIRIAVLGIAGYLLLTQVFIFTRVKGNDMFPAVKDGDLIIGFRLQQEYLKDDLILYTIDGDTKVGRLIAQENDVVSMDDSGILVVGGAAQGGETLFATYSREGISYPHRVAEDQVFVLGDYRTQATDSRDFGSIPTESVLGKVITLLRRRGL